MVASLLAPRGQETGTETALLIFGLGTLGGVFAWRAGGAEGWQRNSRLVSQGLGGGFCTGGSVGNWEQLALNPRPLSSPGEHCAGVLSPRWGFGFWTIGLQGLTPLAIGRRPVGADVERRSCIMFRRTGRGGKRENALALGGIEQLGSCAGGGRRVRVCGGKARGGLA